MVYFNDARACHLCSNLHYKPVNYKIRAGRTEGDNQSKSKGSGNEGKMAEGSTFREFLCMIDNIVASRLRQAEGLL